MTDKMPPARVDPARLAEMRAFYTELLGFVPPRIEARVAVGSRLDPEGLELQEELWAVANLAFLFRGLPAINMGSEIIKKLADDEGAST